MAGRYQNLVVWKKSIDLVAQICLLIRLLPKEEIYALGDQMLRAAISIPSNITEGEALGGKDFVRFLKIADGSRIKLETQMALCVRLKYLTSADVESALNALGEIGKMLSRLIRSLQPPANSLQL